MKTFVSDTRQRLHLVETQADADVIARKFLATQLSNLVPVSKTYPFVADDYESVEFKAPGVLNAYAKNKHVEPAELDRLVSNVNNLKYAKEHVPAFDEFMEVVKPPEGKEVYAFFVHGQIQKNLSDHVNYMTDDFYERQRLFKAIRDYTTPQSPELITTIGKFLQQLHVGPTAFFEEPQKIQKTTVQNDSDDDEPMTVEMDAVPHEQPDLWENPILRAFKVEAGLASQFCNTKASKQVLVSMFAPHEVHLVEKHMGRFQSQVPQVASENTEWKQLLTVYTPAQLKAVTQTEQAQQFFRRQQDKPKSNIEWVQRLLEARQPLSEEVLKILAE